MYSNRKSSSNAICNINATAEDCALSAAEQSRLLWSFLMPTWKVPRVQLHPRKQKQAQHDSYDYKSFPLRETTIRMHCFERRGLCDY